MNVSKKTKKNFSTHHFLIPPKPPALCCLNVFNNSGFIVEQ